MKDEQRSRMVTETRWLGLRSVLVKAIMRFVSHSITYSLRLQNAIAIPCFRVFPTQISINIHVSRDVMQVMTVINIVHKPGVTVARLLFPPPLLRTSGRSKSNVAALCPRVPRRV
jgi:hypothetical protein